MQIISFLAINYRKMAQIFALFSKTIYVPTTLEKAFEYHNHDIQMDTIKVEIDKLFCNKIFKNNIFPKKYQLITAKFVFNMKYRKNKTILKYKAY